MGKKDKRIDAYIGKAAEFAKPVLNHLRKLVHETCPDVEEAIKWGMPYFIYKDEMMCGMASFKQHCVFGFWKATLMKDPVLLENARKESAMGHLGRITSMKDLPSDVKIRSYIKEAMKLNEDGVKNKITTRGKAKALKEPDYFLKAVKKSKKAWTAYQAFSQSHKNEYVEWITEAKTAPTREKRIAQMMEWLEESKPRNWKYMKEYKK